MARKHNHKVSIKRDGMRAKNGAVKHVVIGDFSKEKQIVKKDGATCRKCGGPISFTRLPNGKWSPAAVDGGDHWDECREWITKGKYGIFPPKGRINMIGPVMTPDHENKQIPPLIPGVAPWLYCLIGHKP